MERRAADDSSDDSQHLRPESEVDQQTPVVVSPLGGAGEVGRSCYQVETDEHTFLVDCGINQGRGGQFPDLRGLDAGQVDAVFLTHAHIDHCGALPKLEREGRLARGAPIVCTSGTASIADLLLRDSLKIHLEEAAEPGKSRHFDEDDVDRVLDRFEPVNGYRERRLSTVVPDVPDSWTIRFGNAGHLLGSSWILLELRGRRVMFSGDLGGRSEHLRDIETPPPADALFVESTYATTNTHPSFSGARSELYETALEAVEDGRPVLIPTFAVGRSQEVLQIFRERHPHLSAEEREQFQIVVDGLAVDATQRYHAFSTEEYLSENVMNYVENAADFEPFLPDDAISVSKHRERAEIVDPSGTATPIVVCPSGMLSGGLSPVYLAELQRYYGDVQLLFTGYQAAGTRGRKIQDASGDEVELTVESSRPLRRMKTDDTDQNGVTLTRLDDENDYRFEVTFPTSQATTIHGLSGHAARLPILEFTRKVDPNQIHLVHGNPEPQREFREYLTENTQASTVLPSRMRSIYPVYAGDTSLEFTGDLDAAHPQITVEDEREADSEISDEILDRLTPSGDADDSRLDDSPATASTEQLRVLTEQIAALREEVDSARDEIAALRREVAAARNEAGYTDAEIREIVRDEADD